MSISIKVDCKSNDGGAWCKDGRVKRSLLGFGARCCMEYGKSVFSCKFRDPRSRPVMAPPAPCPATGR